VPTYRAEVPLFSALPQLVRQADGAMLGNLHQRMGDEPVAGAASNGTRNAWGRVISTGIEVNQQGDAAPDSKGRLDGFQVGTDLWADGNWHAGIYVGQLDGDISVNGFARGVYGSVGRNDLRSRYLGAYTTWYGANGFYADAVLQAADHRYTVQPQGNASVSGKGDSQTASIEVGQSLALGQGWTIEPQLQLIYQRVDLDDVSISGARVQQDSDNGWVARAGVRLKGQMSTSLGALQPYGRVNLYRASSGTDIARFVGPAATTDIATRTGGLTLALNPTWSVYGEVGQMFAVGGDARIKSGVQGSVGVKARW
jgi:outer membrane autotransporter protein